MKKLLLAVAAPLMLLASCIKEDSVKFHGIEDIQISVGSIVAINAVVSVENSSCSKIRLSDAMFYLTDPSGNEIAVLTVPEELVLPKKSTTSVTIPFRIKLTNPLAALSLIKDIERQAPRILVTGSTKLKAGALKKKYEVNKLPLSGFISIFGDDIKNLPDNLQMI